MFGLDRRNVKLPLRRNGDDPFVNGSAKPVFIRDWRTFPSGLRGAPLQPMDRADLSRYETSVYRILSRQ
jgi:hypothetical protein